MTAQMKVVEEISPAPTVSTIHNDKGKTKRPESGSDINVAKSVGIAVGGMTYRGESCAQPMAKHVASATS